MPTVPSGPYEGGEMFRLNFSRESDDLTVMPDGARISVDRISIGGTSEIGFYFKFRGDPERILKMLEVVHEAAKQMLPAGRYDDLRG